MSKAVKDEKYLLSQNNSQDILKSKYVLRKQGNEISKIIDEIRDNRKGIKLGDKLTIREMIEEGRLLAQQNSTVPSAKNSK